MQGSAEKLACFRRPRTPKSLAIVLTYAVGLGGCTVGPNFARPDAPPAARYTRDTLRAEDAGVFDYTTEKSPFEEGDLVEIMEGPFNGLIAKVLSAHPRKRAKLLLNTLGSLVQDPCFLRKI